MMAVLRTLTVNGHAYTVAVEPGETLLDPRYERRGSYHAGWNLRLNVDEEQLLEWQRH